MIGSASPTSPMRREKENSSERTREVPLAAVQSPQHFLGISGRAALSSWLPAPGAKIMPSRRCLVSNKSPADFLKISCSFPVWHAQILPVRASTGCRTPSPAAVPAHDFLPRCCLAAGTPAVNLPKAPDLTYNAYHETLVIPLPVEVAAPMSCDRLSHKGAPGS